MADAIPTTDATTGAPEPKAAASANPADLQELSVVPFIAYPLVSGAWDGDAADKRVRAWASRDGSGNANQMDWAKYRKAFAWWDRAKQNEFGAYKLQHHDVQNGKLVTSIRGVQAAWGALKGARGGVDIPAADRPTVTSHLERERARIGKKAAEFGDCWQELTDSGLERRSFGIEARSINEQERSIRVRASDTTLDSYDEVVEQDWDLSRFEKNSPVLYNHNRGTGGMFGGGISQLESLPVGYAKDVAVVSGALEATLVFVDDKASPLAPYVWEAYRQGSLKAVSVGFRVGKRLVEELPGGGEISHLQRNTLFEISAVPLPANPNAVVLGLEGGAPVEDEPEVEELSALAELEAQAELAEFAEPVPAESPAAAEPPTKVESKTDVASESEARTDISVDLSAVNAKINQIDAVLAKVVAERDAALLEAEAQKADLAILLAGKEADRIRIETAERALAQEKVQQLVGRKIMPAEVPSCVEDFLRDRKSFEERIALRADLRMTERVIQPERLDSLPNESAHSAKPQKTASTRLREKYERNYNAR